MPNYAIETIECARTEEFFEHLLDPRRLVPRNRFEAHWHGKRGWIFRGQANADWPLLPSAFRPGNPLKNYAPQTTGERRPGEITTDTGRREYVGWAMQAELRAIHLFADYADRLGFPTPSTFGEERRHTALINAALNAQEFDCSEPFPHTSFLPTAALAQHHGVPTRLLDWTESPLVAAFFAAYPASALIPEQERAKAPSIAVVMLRLRHGPRGDTPPLQLVQPPRHSHDFLRAQSGLFTYTGRANGFFLQNGRWPDLSDSLAESGDTHAVRLLTLPSREANRVLKQLLIFDTTRHALMPSLQSAANANAYVTAVSEL